jgi:hypothetical protein
VHVKKKELLLTLSGHALAKVGTSGYSLNSRIRHCEAEKYSSLFLKKEKSFHHSKKGHLIDYSLIRIFIQEKVWAI